jgi:hypothetical protein
MGYRSQVAIAVADKYEGKLEELLGEDLWEYADSKCPTGVFLDYVKWYGDVPEVMAVMEFLDSLDSEEYGFIELGEDPDHYEERGFPWEYDLYIQRSIHLPW